MDIFTLIDRVKHATAEQFVAEFERMRLEELQRKRRAARRAQQRFDDALLLMTTEQAARVASLVFDGYKTNKAWVSGDRQRVALMLVGPQKWHTGRQRLVRELRVVYPDGHTTATTERTISVERNF